MRAAEFLRSVVDMLDSIKDDKPAQQVPVQQVPVIVNVNSGDSSNNNQQQSPEITTDNTGAFTQPLQQQSPKITTDNTGTFTPPLQQKIELLKKSAGVKSIFDQTAEEDEPFDD